MRYRSAVAVGTVAAVTVSLGLARVVQRRADALMVDCSMGRIRTPEERRLAKETGLAYDEGTGCIIVPAAARVTLRPATTAATTAAAATPAAPGDTLLAEARRGFRTTIAVRSERPLALPQPPATVFSRVDYAGGEGRSLAAYVTPDPRDGRRHPAIVWITGGESNSLDNFWSPRSDRDDESASAFRKAGVVMMFPTLRGGNTNPGAKEYLLGEADDVLAAAEQLASLPYVDPAQIYLGGHSTGGTLALLVAEQSTRFAGVFAFGPVARAESYPQSIAPIGTDAREIRLRSPVYWLAGLRSPTWVIEGRTAPSNIDSVNELCESTANALLHCVRPTALDHFSVLAPVQRVIAARLMVAKDIPFALTDQDVAAATSAPRR